MFLRFVAPAFIEDSNHRRGVFAAAYELWRGGALHPSERRALRECLDWFEAHLPLPDGARLDPRALFWFKDAPTEALANAWELARLLGEGGVRVERVRSRRPGVVVYEDPAQVAAVPYADSFDPRNRSRGRPDRVDGGASSRRRAGVP